MKRIILVSVKLKCLWRKGNDLYQVYGMDIKIKAGTSVQKILIGGSGNCPLAD